MFKYTHDQHLIHGYNGIPWSEWAGVDDQFDFTFDRPKRFDLSWRDANREAAARLGERSTEMGRPIGLTLSGGMDGQLMILAFRDAGVPFEVFHYTIGNPAEDRAARTVAEVFNLSVREIVIDPKWFFTEYAQTYTMSGAIIHNNLCMHCHLIRTVHEGGYLPVLGEQVMVRKLGREWGFGKGCPYMATTRYSIHAGIPSIPSFFAYLPEQLYAFFTHPRMQDIVTGRIKETNQDITIDAHKYLLYREDYPEVIYIPKRTGIEHLVGEDWYGDALGVGFYTRHGGPYGSRFYKRFRYYRPDGVIAYMEGRGDLVDATIPPSRNYHFPRYPE